MDACVYTFSVSLLCLGDKWIEFPHYCWVYFLFCVTLYSDLHLILWCMSKMTLWVILFLGYKESFSNFMIVAFNSVLRFTLEILFHSCLPYVVIFLPTPLLLMCLVTLSLMLLYSFNTYWRPALCKELPWCLQWWAGQSPACMDLCAEGEIGNKQANTWRSGYSILDLLSNMAPTRHMWLFKFKFKTASKKIYFFIYTSYIVSVQ